MTGKDVMAADSKGGLHRLIDELPERDVEAVQRFAEYLQIRSQHPAIRAAMSAPIDDEPETPEEAMAVREGLVALAEGRVIDKEEDPTSRTGRVGAGEGNRTLTSSLGS
jgi:hypothetical protein